MANEPINVGTLAEHGWALVSAEARAKEHLDTFQIPSLAKRSALLPGQAAKLLFDIETREAGRVLDRGVDRMWVIVQKAGQSGYVGVLDNDPGTAPELKLHEGDQIAFGPEHVADIADPPPGFVIDKYGPDFFA